MQFISINLLVTLLWHSLLQRISDLVSDPSTLWQVVYAEVPVSTLGSLSYAEDDGKHILGLKAVQPTAVGGASLGAATPTVSEVGDGHGALYCCYVIECATEVSDC